MFKTLKLSAVALLSAPLFLSSTVGAEVQRQHGAHEHGFAQLQIASDGDELLLSLETPAFNLLGFGAPSSDYHVRQVHALEAVLAAPLNLFEPIGVACAVEAVHLDSALFEERGSEHHDEHTNEQQKHEEHEVGHAGEDHDEDEDEHEGHNEIHAAWHLQCQQLGGMEALVVHAFERFKHLETLQVEYLLGTTQGSQRLNADDSALNF